MARKESAAATTAWRRSAQVRASERDVVEPAEEEEERRGALWEA